MRAGGDQRGGGRRHNQPPRTSPDVEPTRSFARGASGGGNHDTDRTQHTVRPADDTDDEGGRAPEPGGADPGPAGRGRRLPGRRIRPRTIVALALLIAALLPVGTWGWVWYTARQDDRQRSDAIIVLGASQYNGNPSPVFEARLRHAAKLYDQGVAHDIVTVGGNQPGDNYTEGGAGRDWLIENGLPRDRVSAVTEGGDTLQSMDAVATLFSDEDWTSAIIVTDPWHSLRARVMAEDTGMEAGTSPARSGPTVIERRTQLVYISRETASIWYYWLFDDSSDVKVDATG